MWCWLGTDQCVVLHVVTRQRLGAVVGYLHMEFLKCLIWKYKW